MRRSLIDRPPLHQLLLYTTFGRHALACAAVAPAGSSRRKQALAIARRYANKARNSRLPLMAAGSMMLDGGVAELDGRHDDAIAAYRKAATAMDDRETMLFGHAVRVRLGVLVGGDEGNALRATAFEWLAGQGARDPETMFAAARALLPRPRREHRARVRVHPTVVAQQPGVPRPPRRERPGHRTRRLSFHDPGRSDPQAAAVGAEDRHRARRWLLLHAVARRDRTHRE
jgi:hypothetical protein